MSRVKRNILRGDGTTWFEGKYVTQSSLVNLTSISCSLPQKLVMPTQAPVPAVLMTLGPYLCKPVAPFQGTDSNV